MIARLTLAATALASRPDRNPDLSDSAAALDEGAGIRIRREAGLKRAVLVIAQKTDNLPGEGRCLDELHPSSVSATGG